MITTMRRTLALLAIVSGLILAGASSNAANAASCSESTAFLARTSGLDATHTTAYDNLICGLVTDGVWAKLDLLYIFATENSATALLNLTSSSYTLTVHNVPAFSVDRGYQATCCGGDNIQWASDVNDWLDTGLNVPTAKYTADTAHLSVWNLTNGADSDGPIVGDGGSDPYMWVNLQGHFLPKINATGDAVGFVIGDPRGHLIGTRWCPNGHCSDTTNFSDVAITIASPALSTTGVNHNLVADLPVIFSTSPRDIGGGVIQPGVLPTGIVAGTTYYVIAAGLTATQFEISGTIGGAAVNTGGSQSGIQSVRGPYTTVSGYQNGSSLGDISSAPVNGPQNTLAILQKYSAPRHGSSDTQHQIAMASAGGALNPTDASNFSARLRTYMTAVGVP